MTPALSEGEYDDEIQDDYEDHKEQVTQHDIDLILQTSAEDFEKLEELAESGDPDWLNSDRFKKAAIKAGTAAGIAAAGTFIPGIGAPIAAGAIAAGGAMAKEYL